MEGVKIVDFTFFLIFLFSLLDYYSCMKIENQKHPKADHL